MSIDEKWKEGNKLLLHVRNDLELLETEKDTSVFLQTRLTTNINQLSRVARDVSELVKYQGGPKKDTWRMRAQQLVEDCKTSRHSMDFYFTQKFNKTKEEDKKATNKQSLGQSSEVMKDLRKEAKLLQESHKLIDNLTNAGMAIITVLGDQNTTIKESKTKLLDLAHRLSLSQKLLHLIQKRDKHDKVIFFSGMVLTLLILFFLWWLLF